MKILNATGKLQKIQSGVILKIFMLMAFLLIGWLAFPMTSQEIFTFQVVQSEGLLDFRMITGPGILFLILFLVILFGILVFIIIRQKREQIRSLMLSKENELLLNDLINTQPAAIYRILLSKDYTQSPEGMPVIKYEFISGQHEEITGLSEIELKENALRIIEQIHPDERADFIRHNNDAIREFRNFRWEGRVVFNNQVKWLRIESTPRKLNNGDIIWTGFIIDISPHKELEAQIRWQKEFESLLASISTELVNITSDNFDQCLNKALGKIGEFCGTDRAYIFVLDEAKNLIINTHEWTAQGIGPVKDKLQEVPCLSIPGWMAKLKEFKPITVEDVKSLPEGWEAEKTIFEAQEIKSLASVPIISNQRLYGFVGFDSVVSYRRWKEYEIHLLQVFADLLFNVLERKENEQKWLESQKMLRMVLDAIRVRVFWKDMNLNYMGCNQSFARDAGLRFPEELLGKNDFDMPWKEEANLYRKDDADVIKSGKARLNYEEPQTEPSGKVKWLRTSKIPLKNSNGELIGVLGTYEDITRQKNAEDLLKASEKKYRILTENAFDGIYLLLGDSLQYVNQRFCELTGYSFEELTAPGFNIYSLFTPEGMKIVEDRKSARLQNMPVPSIYEIQMIRKSGAVIDVELSTTPLSKELLILGVMRDVTERKYNEKLINEITIARQSVQFKQSFLANMSHEIRTPLTGVIGMIEILSNTRLDKKQTDYINTLKLSTENLREIINQILDYSKIEAGHVKLRKTVFNKNTILDNAKKLFETICHKKIKLETGTDDQIPEYLSADEQRIAQIIHNLLSNAVKFTFKGKISLIAHLEEWIDDKNLLIRIDVTDSGIGIRKEFLPKLFKPFEQFEFKNSLYFEGTGLGLTICKELAELMGGEISVESTEGKGSSFSFTFIAEKVDPESEFEPLKHQLTTPEFVRPLKILFAEDKIVNQKVVSLMLKSMGHEVIIANNGIEAVEKYKLGGFDLILMDIQMPLMDGIAATQNLKLSNTKLPPVVGLSANAFEGDREKYMDMGMDDYLSKPVKSDDFIKLIQRLKL